MSDTQTELELLTKQIKNAVDALVNPLAQFGQSLEALADNMLVTFSALPPEAYHQFGLLHPLERIEKHYPDVAEPAEVVQYILQQPKHTWMGVTIMPDEAWRYEQKSDWMWWRQ